VLGVSIRLNDDSREPDPMSVAEAHQAGGVECLIQWPFWMPTVLVEERGLRFASISDGSYVPRIQHNTRRHRGGLFRCLPVAETFERISIRCVRRTGPLALVVEMTMGVDGDGKWCPHVGVYRASRLS